MRVVTQLLDKQRAARARVAKLRVVRAKVAKLRVVHPTSGLRSCRACAWRQVYRIRTRSERPLILP